MNIFLDELSKTTQDNMDGAGWHKSKNLIIPSNIRIILLPPYCLELNPVERLWKYIKNNTIKNKVFDTLENLQNEICEFVSKLTNDIVCKVCRCDWFNFGNGIIIIYSHEVQDESPLSLKQVTSELKASHL